MVSKRFSEKCHGDFSGVGEVTKYKGLFMAGIVKNFLLRNC